MTLTEFLREQLSEDMERSERVMDRLQQVENKRASISFNDDEIFDASDVVARFQSHLRLVELHRPSDERNRWCDHCKGTEHAEYPCPSLRVLGLAYAHREGYRDEWRP